MFCLSVLFCIVTEANRDHQLLSGSDSSSNNHDRIFLLVAVFKAINEKSQTSTYN